LLLVDYTVRTAIRMGIDHIFGVGGANIEDMIDSLQHQSESIKTVLAKHEYSAGAAACGYSLTSGKPGIVLTTSGGGAMYLLPAIAEAFASCIPLLAIIGQPPAYYEGHGAFQDSSGLAGTIDAEELFAATSLYCRRIESPINYQHHLVHALEIATGTCPGPAVLLIPKDVQLTKLNSKDPHHNRIPVTDHDTLDEESHRLGDIWLMLTDAAQKGTGKVLIIAGQGVARHNARAELAVLAEKLNALVATAPDARDTYDDYAPRYIGVTGAVGHPDIADAVSQAELVLIIGTRMPQFSAMGLEQVLLDKNVISINFERSYLNRNFTRFNLLEIIANVREALLALLGLSGLGQADTLTLAEKLFVGTQPVPHDTNDKSDYKTISILDVLNHLRAIISDDANIMVDAGNTGATVVHHLEAPRRGRMGLALGMGGMGFSFGAAVGAACGNQKPTWVLAGDGSFFMHGSEIHTAIQHNLPITCIIFNNNAHGMCYTRAKIRCGTDIECYLFNSSQIGAGLAAMFPGLSATDASTIEEVQSFLAQTSISTGPRVLSINLDVNEVPPFLPFKKHD